MQLASRYTERKALAITLLWVVALAATGATDALLFLAPALLIAIPLLGGRYVGEELIARLAARRARAPRQTANAPASPPAPAHWFPRGNDLIAFALAKRPPPPLLLPQT